MEPVPEGAWTAVLRLLEDPHPIVNSDVVQTLAWLRPMPTQARDALARLLSGPRPATDVALVAHALLRDGIERRAGAPAHSGWSFGVLVDAAVANPEHRPPLATVAGSVHDVIAWIASYRAAPEPWTRKSVAELLRAPAFPGPVAIATLDALLRDPEAYVLSAAAESLATHGPGASGSVPRLVSCVRAGDWSVRQAAADALRAVQAR